ncbi:MAG: CPBP family intramembrane metalloprotease [Muribaculaceae bacterium]|nr:CPBP family intramembrane metalloprotease [Muribaculaceae bacterium]
MKKTKGILDIIKYLLVYGLLLVTPVTIIAVIEVVSDHLKGGTMDSEAVWQTPYMTTGLLVGTLLCIAVFLWRRWAALNLGKIRRSDLAMVILMSLLLFLGWCFPEDFLNRLIDIPDKLTAEDYDNLTGGIVGLIDTGIMTPVAEEILCRGAILGALLRLMPRRPWIAIVIQALIFGLIHMNPVQIVFGTLYGVMLGWLAWRTSSLLPGIVVHVANNSSVLLLPDAFDESLAKLNTPMTITALVVSFAILVLGFRWFQKKYRFIAE